jgi:peptide/nickel transport system permease protein
VADTVVVSSVQTDPVPGDEPGSGKKRRRLGLAFWLPALWVFLILFGAVFADLLPLQDPNVPDKCAQYVVPQFNINTGEETMPVYEPGQVIDGVRVDLCTADSRANAKPSSTHWLGTDSSARDTFARAVYGARVAMIAGVVTIAIGLVVGGTIGLIAGFRRGKSETFLMAIVDIMLAFPTLVLALAIVAVLGRGLTNACIAITVVAIPAFARITRANTLSYAEREFVTAARVMGAKNTRIMIREILPNVIFPVVAFALVAIAVAIVAEGSLAFLSLSVKDPNASWGQMILDGRGVIDEWPHVSLIPSAIMFITVLAFNLLGEQFRQIFNVRDAAL